MKIRSVYFIPINRHRRGNQTVTFGHMIESQMASHPVFQLIAGVQAYDWGKIGSDSKAAQYAQAIPGFDLDGSTPYAEVRTSFHTIHLVSDRPKALDGDTSLLPFQAIV